MFQKQRKRKGRTMKMLENKSKLRSERKKNLTFGFGSPRKSLQNVALNSELHKKSLLKILHVLQAKLGHVLRIADLPLTTRKRKETRVHSQFNFNIEHK
jgi:hypothetical protein